MNTPFPGYSPASDYCLRPAGWPLPLVLSWSTDHAERPRVLRSAPGEASDAGRCTLIEPAPLAAARAVDAGRVVSTRRPVSSGLGRRADGVVRVC